MDAGVVLMLSAWLCFGTDMPSSQPIDIPDTKKRNKKKKRCRATDSFSGRFEGERYRNSRVRGGPAGSSGGAVCPQNPGNLLLKRALGLMSFPPAPDES